MTIAVIANCRLSFADYKLTLQDKLGLQDMTLYVATLYFSDIYGCEIDYHHRNLNNNGRDHLDWARLTRHDL